MTTPPSLSIPRIIPPQGERAPLTAGPVKPLPLEPDLVPNPPLRPDQIPLRTSKPVNAMPAPAAAPLAPPGKPWYLTLEAFPSDRGVADQVRWLLAHYPVDQVRAQWEGHVGGPQVFATIEQDYTREVDAYVRALEAYNQAQALAAPPAVPPVLETSPPAADPDEPSAEELAAAHAEPPAYVNPPRVTFPEERQAQAAAAPTQRLPTGSVIVTVPAKAAEPAPSAAPAETPAEAAAAAEKRRLGRKAKEKVLELHAQGQDRQAIARATGLPMELVDRALEGATKPAAVAEQGAAAEAAYQAAMQAAPEAEAESPAVEQAARQKAAERVAERIAQVGRAAAASGASLAPWDLVTLMDKVSVALNYYGPYEIEPEKRERSFCVKARALRDDLTTLLHILEQGEVVVPGDGS